MASPTLIYGMSGTGKTTWYLKLARYKWLKEGKKTRWYLGDGGGQTLEIVGGEEFLEVMNYTLWDNPFDTTAKICEGFWPADPNDPKSKLLPPPADLGSKYGLFVFENITSMGNYLMNGMASRYAQWRDKNQGKATVSVTKDEEEKSPTSWFREGDTLVGRNTMTHFGQVQSKMLDNIQRTRVLPGLVGWTAWERTADDDSGRLQMLGPDVVGKALTKSIGGSFGHTIRLVCIAQPKEKATPDPTTKANIRSRTLEYRAYLRRHADPLGLQHLECYANVRFPELVQTHHPELIPEFIPGSNPFDFYEMMEALRQKEAELAHSEIATRQLVIL